MKCSCANSTGSAKCLSRVRCIANEILLLALILTALSAEANGKRNISPNARELEVERKLQQLNKPAVKSIKSEDGDVIDCVDILKQPALDHPLLKDHKIKMKPSIKLVPTRKSNFSFEASQVWRRNGSCPEGTVPIRRVKKSELMRAASLETFGRKKGHYVIRRNASTLQSNDPLNTPNAVIFTEGFNYYGAHAEINVWQPYVEDDEEYSSAQIWLEYGRDAGFHSLQSGWIVNPSLFGDKNTRFFSYWTSDGSASTGCFNLLCSGFVQTSQDVVLGGAIGPISAMHGPQYSVWITIYYDDELWWLQFGDKTVGYWPAAVFGSTANGASLTLWGGEVNTSMTKKPHTRTNMGNGEFPSLEETMSAFFYNIRIRDNNPVWKIPQYLWAYATQVNCYGAFKYQEVPTVEARFYYGGPGLNWNCP